MDKFFTIIYGSKLYGTNTPTSDTDLKTVYMPSFRDLMLNHRLAITKDRLDENGKPVPNGDSMPDRGVEEEFFPLHTFVKDYVNGQTYAVEMVHAFMQNREVKFYGNQDKQEFVVNLINGLFEKFSTGEVSSMVGFAMKQTFDYVHRGDRLNKVRNVIRVLNLAQNKVNLANGTAVRVTPLRLDDIIETNMTVFDYVVQLTSTKVGSIENNGRQMRSLELNGRSYSETTSVETLLSILNKLEKSYGERTNKASETDVDFKSLSHAVRVYEQATELLENGVVTFPRPNAEYLLEVKSGKADLEKVKTTLLQLDKDVQKSRERNNFKFKTKTQELLQELDEWLYLKLQEYHT